MNHYKVEVYNTIYPLVEMDQEQENGWTAFSVEQDDRSYRTLVFYRRDLIQSSRVQQLLEENNRLLARVRELEAK